MSDEPTYIDWLTTIEPEEVCEIASKYGNRYAEITEEQIEELRAGKVLCYVDEYGIFIRLKRSDIVVRVHFIDTRSRRAILRKSGCTFRGGFIRVYFKRGYSHQHKQGW